MAADAWSQLAASLKLLEQTVVQALGRFIWLERLSLSRVSGAGRAARRGEAARNLRSAEDRARSGETPAKPRRRRSESIREALRAARRRPRRTRLGTREELETVRRQAVDVGHRGAPAYPRRRGRRRPMGLAPRPRKTSLRRQAGFDQARRLPRAARRGRRGARGAGVERRTKPRTRLAARLGRRRPTRTPCRSPRSWRNPQGRHGGCGEGGRKLREAESRASEWREAVENRDRDLREMRARLGARLSERRGWRTTRLASSTRSSGRRDGGGGEGRRAHPRSRIARGSVGVRDGSQGRGARQHARGVGGGAPNRVHRRGPRGAISSRRGHGQSPAGGHGEAERRGRGRAARRGGRRRGPRAPARTVRMAAIPSRLPSTRRLARR